MVQSLGSILLIPTAGAMCTNMFATKPSGPPREVLCLTKQDKTNWLKVAAHGNSPTDAMIKDLLELRRGILERSKGQVKKCSFNDEHVYAPSTIGAVDVNALKAGKKPKDNSFWAFSGWKHHALEIVDESNEYLCKAGGDECGPEEVPVMLVRHEGETAESCFDPKDLYSPTRISCLVYNSGIRHWYAPIEADCRSKCQSPRILGTTVRDLPLCVQNSVKLNAQSQNNTLREGTFYPISASQCVVVREIGNEESPIKADGCKCCGPYQLYQKPSTAITMFAGGQSAAQRAAKRKARAAAKQLSERKLKEEALCVAKDTNTRSLRSIEAPVVKEQIENENKKIDSILEKTEKNEKSQDTEQKCAANAKLQSKKSTKSKTRTLNKLIVGKDVNDVERTALCSFQRTILDPKN